MKFHSNQFLMEIRKKSKSICHQHAMIVTVLALKTELPQVPECNGAGQVRLATNWSIRQDSIRPCSNCEGSGGNSLTGVNLLWRWKGIRIPSVEIQRSKGNTRWNTLRMRVKGNLLHSTKEYLEIYSLNCC